MNNDKYNFFESITPKKDAYIDVLATTALMFSVYRYENNMTQAQLAKKLGITQAMVSKLESGDLNISLKNLSDYLFDMDLKLEITSVHITNKVNLIGCDESVLTSTVKEPKFTGVLLENGQDWSMAA